MTFKEITSGLRKLLLDNNYNPTTIKFYEREWNKIQSFLTETYGDSMFDMERGLAYLENKYGIRIEDTVVLTKKGVKRFFTDDKSLKIIK